MYPEEVEAVLKAHPDVYDAVVVGVPNERWGEQVTRRRRSRCRVPSSRSTMLVEHCRGQLAGYKVPREVVLVDTIVRSPAGKADYRWAKQVATALAPRSRLNPTAIPDTPCRPSREVRRRARRSGERHDRPTTTPRRTRSATR